MKSASDLIRDKDKVTKRNPRFRPTSDDDWRWLWASYQMNDWADVMRADLNREAFQEAVLTILGGMHVDWIAEVQTPTGLRPVALFVGERRFGEHAIEAHVKWFSWATPRNKLECGVQFFKDIGKQMKVFAYPKLEDDLLWERVWRYKVLKKGCKISDCYGKGEDAVMYYTPGPF